MWNADANTCQRNQQIIPVKGGGSIATRRFLLPSDKLSGGPGTKKEARG